MLFFYLIDTCLSFWAFFFVARYPCTFFFTLFCPIGTNTVFCLKFCTDWTKKYFVQFFCLNQQFRMDKKKNTSYANNIYNGILLLDVICFVVDTSCCLSSLIFCCTLCIWSNLSSANEVVALLQRRKCYTAWLSKYSKYLVGWVYYKTRGVSVRGGRVYFTNLVVNSKQDRDVRSNELFRS